MLAKKKSLKKGMAILACTALVSLCLPTSLSPSDKTSKNSTNSMTYYARALLLSTISADLILDGLDTSRIIQGNSKSKKKPGDGGD
jgi:hypothetical protein